MEVTEDDVRKLARLAHVALTPAQIDDARGHLATLIDYVAQIQAIDVEGVPEFCLAGPESPPLRPDAVRPGLTRDAAMSGAPAASSGLFEVPRVVSRRGDGPPAGADAPAGDAK